MNHSRLLWQLLQEIIQDDMDKKQLNDSLASIKNSSADRIILPGKMLWEETLI